MYGYRVRPQGDPHPDPAPQPEAASVPHGHLVAYHLLSQLPVGTQIEDVRMPGADRLEIVVRDPQRVQTSIHLVGIDFDDFYSIRAGLVAVPNDDDAVVVLSWGLVDCELAAAYARLPEDPSVTTIMEFFGAALHAVAGELVDFAELLCVEFEKAGKVDLLDIPQGQDCATVAPEHLVGLAAVVAVAEFSEAAFAALDWTPDEATTHFAAAGNQGLGFPMPPASWSEIVGVEACADLADGSSPPDKASFSNVGSMPFDDHWTRALGAWFQTPEVHPMSNAPLGYWGTSFATPTAALRNVAVGFNTRTCP